MQSDDPPASPKGDDGSTAVYGGAEMSVWAPSSKVQWADPDRYAPACRGWQVHAAQASSLCLVRWCFGWRRALLGPTPCPLAACRPRWMLASRRQAAIGGRIPAQDDPCSVTRRVSDSLDETRRQHKFSNLHTK